MAEGDFLDRMIAKRARRNPEFPRLVEASRRRRELLGTLTVHRQSLRLTPADVAAAMHTSPAVVEQLEREADDVPLSTLEAYAAALGYAVEYHLIPEWLAGETSPLVIHDS